MAMLLAGILVDMAAHSQPHIGIARKDLQHFRPVFYHLRIQPAAPYRNKVVMQEEEMELVRMFLQHGNSPLQLCLAKQAGHTTGNGGIQQGNLPFSEGKRRKEEPVATNYLQHLLVIVMVAWQPRLQDLPGQLANQAMVGSNPCLIAEIAGADQKIGRIVFRPHLLQHILQAEIRIESQEAIPFPGTEVTVCNLQ